MWNHVMHFRNEHARLLKTSGLFQDAVLQSQTNSNAHSVRTSSLQHLLLKNSALHFCSQLFLLWDTYLFYFTISQSFTHIVSQMYLLCPLPEWLHELFG